MWVECPINSLALLIIDCLCIDACCCAAFGICRRRCSRSLRYHLIRSRLTTGLIVGIITAIGTIITAIVAGITAAILAFFATITAVLSLISRTIVKVVSLPFRLCLGNRDPISPLGNSAVRFNSQ